MSVSQDIGKLFPVGDREVFASVSQFNGDLKIHIRKYFRQDVADGETALLIPTKCGVALNVEEFAQLQSLIPRLQDIVERNSEVSEDGAKRELIKKYGILTVISTDEIETAKQAKVRLVLTLVYGNLRIHEVFDNLKCEGCENHWPSQRDHVCCMQSEDETVENGYEDVTVNLDSLVDLCEELLKLVDLPTTLEWETFIHQLPNVSARTMFFFWRDFVYSCNPEKKRVVNCVDMMCSAFRNERAWNQNMFDEFESYMNNTI
ncbi:hypothetical protein AC249_AIPGENE5745 [Exaiptasia diaphana]|nr:hypothetical protein AC249_AIPGENE5745 [Exaiptasia diaphana]